MLLHLKMSCLGMMDEMRVFIHIKLFNYYEKTDYDCCRDAPCHDGGYGWLRN